MEQREERKSVGAPQGKEIGAENIQSYLSGINYPASRQDLMRMAQDRGVPDTITDALGSIPDRIYENHQDVVKEIGRGEEERWDDEEDEPDDEAWQ